MTEDTERPRPPILIIVLGAAVFSLAAALRLFHLNHGLRHEPDGDERIFVENALGMIARGDWDHRFYEYPGLLLWILRIVLTVTDARGAEAYLYSRTLVALVSAATVVLVFGTVSHWVSRRAGLVASLMLSFSPLDIETAHMLRPDAVIAPLLLAALALAAPRNGKGSLPWAWAAATVATAIKFSAALVFAPLLVSARVRRIVASRIVALILASLALFTALSPYTLMAGVDSLAGMRTQLAYHYEGAPMPGFAAMLGGFLADTLPRALSLPGLALSAWGAALGLRDRSRWALCWVLFPALWIATFSTTGARYGRFVVPVLGALCFLAAVGLEDLFKRSRVAALATAVLVLALPVLGTRRYLAFISAPQTLDRALDWIAGAPRIESVGSSVLELGVLETSGREIVPLRGFHGEAFVASQFDALVLPDAIPAPPGFLLATRFAPDSLYNGPAVSVFRALAPRRFAALDLTAAVVRSNAPGRDPQLTDGQVSTRWRADASPAFIEIAWPAPVSPSRLEIAFGATPPEREIGLTLSDEGGAIETHSIRPPLDRQRPATSDLSQLLAWPARPTRTLRIVLAGSLPLRIGELRIFAEAGH